MIEFTRSYKTADGKVFATIEQAQIHEIEELLTQVTSVKQCPQMNLNDWATLLLGNKAVLVDILTMTPNSKPRARKMHGGTKNRTKKTVITDAVTSVTTSQNDPATDAQ